MEEKMDTMDMPRFSFLLISYNQENYIEEALQSAFDQDYPNLEIVVCDDCSQDRTFELASRMAQAYRGPHRVILHRNETNLGIGANFQQAYELSSGDWLFMAAGDDVSLPNRCWVVAEGIRNYPQALAFATNYQIIDENGKVYGYSHERRLLESGAAICWNKKIFSSFKPLSSEIHVEDSLLLLRIFLLNGIYVKLPEVCLKYRQDGHNYLSIRFNNAYNTKKYEIKVREDQIGCLSGRLADMEYLQEKGVDIPNFADLFRLQQRMIIARRKEIEYRKQVLWIMTLPYNKRIMSVFSKNMNPLLSSFAKRLRIVLSSIPFLIQLKRAIVRPRTTAEKLLLSGQCSIPEGQPGYIDCKMYLSSSQYDYCAPDDCEGFYNYSSNKEELA